MKTKIFYFYDIDKSCIAGIEFVIIKYGKKKWFNAALKKVVQEVYCQKRKDICDIPFIIIKKENNLKYVGYNYIIKKIEQYNSNLRS